MPNESTRAKLDISHLLPNVAGLFLAASGSIILAWVGWLTWYDMTTWSKNIALILFGSRTGEAISQGVGMKVIYYFLISLALIMSGMFAFLRNRSKASKLQRSRPLPTQRQKGTEEKKDNVSLVVKPLIRETEEKKDKEEPTVKPLIRLAKEEIYFSGCLHHFGYLASRPKGVSIPEECIICQKLGDCMVATVRKKS